MIARSWNENWKYIRLDHPKEIDDLHKETGWEEVTLPHDAMIHDKRDAKSPGGNANAFYVGGVYVYQKKFYVAKTWKGHHIELEFGGVYRHTTVYVNGKKAKYWAYGYTCFAAELDSFLEFDSENEIIVVADNSQLPNSRWYSGGGIYRPVKILEGGRTYIRRNGVKVTTLSVDPVRLHFEISTSGSGIPEVVIVDPVSKQEVMRKKCENKGQTKELYAAEIEISNGKLWSEENPYLYHYQVLLRDKEDANQVLDESIGTFGIRTLSWSKDGFKVNNIGILLRGACIHHDNGALGSVSTYDVEKRKIKIMKKMGFNSIRMSHHPASDELLKACDELGMYVMDETFDMWFIKKNRFDYSEDFSEWHMKDIDAMIDQDFNHPSVIMYSIGNELSEPATEQGMEIASNIIQHFHKKDTTRPLTAGTNLMIIFMAAIGKGIYGDGGMATELVTEKESDGKRDMSSSLWYNTMVSKLGKIFGTISKTQMAAKHSDNILNELDICGYNYGEHRYEKERRLHPDWVMVGSETNPPDIYRNWQLVKKLPNVIGDFMWTGWDYVGEAGLGVWNYDGVANVNAKYPYLLSGTGTIDILGRPGAEAHYAAIVWGMEQGPYLGIQPPDHPGMTPMKSGWRGTNAIDSWSFTGCEGNETIAEVYAAADKAELFVNSKSQGIQKLKECKASWTVTYEPGEIYAISYDQAGHKTGEAKLMSAQSELHIEVALEKKNSYVDEFVYVNISLADSAGNVQAAEDRCIWAQVEGGNLVAIASANPKTEDRFDADHYMTFQGRAQVILKANQPGDMKLLVQGDGLSEVCRDILIQER